MAVGAWVDPTPGWERTFVSRAVDFYNSCEFVEVDGNALDHVKAIADDVCGHVAEDGIYQYCLEKGLI